MILLDLLLEKAGRLSLLKVASTELYGARFNKLRAHSAIEHAECVLAYEDRRIARLEAYIAALPPEKP
ncbi:MAG: hypothetical protein WC100_02525 [Sterolibacterium sp.]